VFVSGIGESSILFFIIHGRQRRAEDHDDRDTETTSGTADRSSRFKVIVIYEQPSAISVEPRSVKALGESLRAVAARRFAQQLTTLRASQCERFSASDLLGVRDAGRVAPSPSLVLLCSICRTAQ
jgi:hypothetical protein